MKYFVTFCLLAFSCCSAAPPTEPGNLNVTEYREAKGLFNFFLGSRCATAYPICPIDCYSESAVIHGYCCGCAGLFEYVPVVCPEWLQCPIRGDQLCSDYRFVMDCCCSRPFF